MRPQGQGTVIDPTSPWALPTGAPPVLSHRRSVTSLAWSAVRSVEVAFCVCALLLFSQAFVVFLQPGADGVADAEGNAILRSLFYLVYAVMSVFVVFRVKSFARITVRQPAVLLAIVLAMASVLWSVAPDLTLRRSIALLLTTAFGWYLVARFTPLQIIRLITWTLGLALVLSLGTVIFMPDYGIDSGANFGAWQGIFSHKNTMGRVAALAAWMFILLGLTDRRRWWVYAPGVLLAVGMLFFSQSRTSMVTLATILAVLPLVGVLRWKVTRGAPILAGAILIAGSVGLFLAGNLEVALESIGSDATLTGRTALWAAVLAAGRADLWLGVGYSAFWIDQNPLRDFVQFEAGWSADGAHNGFMDIWLELGLAGLGLMALIIVLASRKALAALRASVTPEAAWPVLAILFIVLSNLSESGLLRQNNLVWVIFVAAVAVAYEGGRRRPAPDPRPGGRPDPRPGIAPAALGPLVVTPREPGPGARGRHRSQ